MAAQITPDDPEVQYNLGAVLEACEQLEEAVKAYERAHKGGIERAQENLRVSLDGKVKSYTYLYILDRLPSSFQNVRAKILSVKLGSKPEEVEEMEKKGQQA